MQVLEDQQERLKAALAKEQPPDAIQGPVTPLDGIELLRLIKEHAPGIEVVVMTADPTVATAVEALKQGAFDYIVKPLNLDELQHLMGRLMERSELRREVNRAAVGEPSIIEPVEKSAAKAA